MLLVLIKQHFGLLYMYLQEYGQFSLYGNSSDLNSYGQQFLLSYVFLLSLILIASSDAQNLSKNSLLPKLVI